MTYIELAILQMSKNISQNMNKTNDLHFGEEKIKRFKKYCV